jgi:hypothetical protein
MWTLDRALALERSAAEVRRKKKEREDREDKERQEKDREDAEKYLAKLPPLTKLPPLKLPLNP